MPPRRTATRRPNCTAPLSHSAIRCAVEALEPRLLLSTYTVTTTADSGTGSLRDAIQNSDADTVLFSIPGTRSQTVKLFSHGGQLGRGPGGGRCSWR